MMEEIGNPQASCKRSLSSGLICRSVLLPKAKVDGAFSPENAFVEKYNGKDEVCSECGTGAYTLSAASLEEMLDGWGDIHAYGCSVADKSN